MFATPPAVADVTQIDTERVMNGNIELFELGVVTVETKCSGSQTPDLIGTGFTQA
jgi:hypothetical protein